MLAIWMKEGGEVEGCVGEDFGSDHYLWGWGWFGWNECLNHGGTVPIDRTG